MIDDKDTSTIELELTEKKKLGRPLKEGRDRALNSTERSIERRQKLLSNMTRDAKNWDIPTCRTILGSDKYDEYHDNALHRYAAIKKITLQQHKVVQLQSDDDTI